MRDFSQYVSEMLIFGAQWCIMVNTYKIGSVCKLCSGRTALE